MGSAKAAEELENPAEFPEVMWEVWGWFMRLNETRTGGLNGDDAITEQEMKAFFENRRIAPEGWQLRALVELDRIKQGRAKVKPAADEEQE